MWHSTPTEQPRRLRRPDTMQGFSARNSQFGAPRRTPPTSQHGDKGVAYRGGVVEHDEGAGNGGKLCELSLQLAVDVEGVDENQAHARGCVPPAGQDGGEREGEVVCPCPGRPHALPRRHLPHASGADGTKRGECT